MTIALVYHDGDFLTAAKDYKAAIKFLIGNRYIAGDDEIFAGNPNMYCHLDEYLGEAWADVMTEEWNSHEFNAFYDYWFEIIEVEVYE